jgi:hypothetical protein
MTTIIDGTSGITFPNSTVQASAGQVLQVVNGTNTTRTQTTSASFVASNLTASITPKFSTSKIMVIASVSGYNDSSGTEAQLTVYRNGSTDVSGGIGLTDLYTGSSDNISNQPILYLDSPATTSSTSYTVYIRRTGGGGSVSVNLRGTRDTIILMEIAA